MNRVFKSKWSVAHQEYVVTDENHRSRGKAAKSAVALAVTALMLGAGAASAAYVDPGFVAKNSSQFAEAVTSWETPEYQKDWGLTALNASTAYALGYTGKGIAVGIMDSGALMQIHPDLTGDRFHAVKVPEQSYGSSGDRYPQHTDGNLGHYEPGAAVPESGEWQKGVNDTHGTHVTGTVGGNRDGSEFHGVAWGADVYVGNTGGTDDTNYGPFEDPQYFYQGWSAIAKAVSDANRFLDGTTRGGFINNSFGTNMRVKDNGSKGPDGGDTGVHFKTNTASETEYEYFLFQQDAKNRVNTDSHWNGRSFVDAAYEAVKDEKVVQVFTTGNRDFANPFYRPLYPYFNPEAEQNWVAVAAMEQADDGSYTLYSTLNEAGEAKWWTVAAPGRAIYSSITDDDGNPSYALFSGTSMAAPHVTGALTVLMQRYDQMDALQVRDVMLTTATHKNGDTDFDGWTAADGEVDARYGWGMPDLKKGMYGIGQFLGKFDYNMRAGSLDVWSNDISQTALDQRKREDLAWKTAAEKWMKNPTMTLGDEYTAEEKTMLGDVMTDTTDDIIGIDNQTIPEADAIAWRKAYYQKRIDAINARAYDGSLVKRGEGTLVMTGNNTYRGGTTVEGGKLLGFAESFGTSAAPSAVKTSVLVTRLAAVPAAADDTAASSNNGKVVVNGGTFGLLEKYNDQFTMKGELTHNDAADHSVDVTVNPGGTFQIAAGQSVSMGTLEFKDGAGYTVGSTDTDVLKEAYAGNAQTGTVTTTGLTGADLAVANPDYAFFKTELKADGNTLTGTLSRDVTKSFASYADTANGRSIAGALEGAASGPLFDSLIGASKTDVQNTYRSLGDDFFLNTRNAGIINGMTLSRAVKDQAAGIGEGRKAEMADGTARLWATGIGSTTSLDYGLSDMDSDFYAGLIGAEVDVTTGTKLGLFFGAGTTNDKAGSSKWKSDDIHVGAYGVTNFGNTAAATYGVIHTHQSADAHRTLQVGSSLGMNAFSGDTNITQVFAEGAYKGFNTEKYSVEPYAGLSWIHASGDSFSEKVSGMTFSTTTEDQNLEVTTLGVRGSIALPLAAAKVSLKGDVAWHHFFGDNRAKAVMNLAGSGVAHLKGGKLSNMASLGLGLEAKLGKMTTLGISYTGAYDGDATSNGVFANLRVNF